MALQMSIAMRNARLDQIETVIGPSGILRIFTGAPPANCAAANSGTILATITLPSDWMNPANNGSKTMLGTWSDAAADAAGTAGHFRIHDSGGTVCGLQGTVTATGGGGDMIVDNVVFAAGQGFSVTSFTITEANA